MILAIIQRNQVMNGHTTTLKPYFFSGLQMFFGVALAFTSYNLAQIKTLAHRAMNGNVVWVGMQNNASEILMLFFGAAIIICAVFQSRKQIKYAVFQIVVGIVIVIFSITQLVLVYTMPYAEFYRVYYLDYFIALLAILVFGMGLVQLILLVKKRMPFMLATQNINKGK